MRNRPGKENLVIILNYLIFIGKNQLRDDGASLQFAFGVQIGDVADNQVVAIEGDGVPLLDQPPDVVVMIDQLVKH